MYASSQTAHLDQFLCQFFLTKKDMLSGLLFKVFIIHFLLRMYLVISTSYLTILVVISEIMETGKVKCVKNSGICVSVKEICSSF